MIFRQFKSTKKLQRKAINPPKATSTLALKDILIPDKVEKWYISCPFIDKKSHFSSFFLKIRNSEIFNFMYSYARQFYFVCIFPMGFQYFSPQRKLSENLLFNKGEKKMSFTVLVRLITSFKKVISQPAEHVPPLKKIRELT